MERLLAWYRVGSSVGAVAALLIANLVPLAGVLWFGWNVWTILIIYWLENGIVGFFNVLKMAAASGSMLPGTSVSGLASSGKLAIIPFFIVHYGIFWLVHGVFVLTLPFFASIGDLAETEGAPVAAVGPDLAVVLIGAVGLFISHGLSYLFNYIRGGEFRTAAPAALMFAPYGRLVILHLTIIFGAFAILSTNAPAAAIAILVGLKTVMDLGFHLKEHRLLAGSAA